MHATSISPLSSSTHRGKLWELANCYKQNKLKPTQIYFFKMIVFAKKRKEMNFDIINIRMCLPVLSHTNFRDLMQRRCITLLSSLKLQILSRREATLHIIHSCPLSSVVVQVIIFQSKSLFCNAFQMNQGRMCEMERPIHYSYLHTQEKDFFFLSRLSFSSTISFFLFAAEHTLQIN